jgi:histo-blood group ABO system transferase
MRDTALVLIATGKLYWQYISPMLKSAYEYFIPHDAFVWTDCPDALAVCGEGLIIPWEPQGFPFTTLLRYHTFLTQRERLEKYKYIFYVDVDAYFSDYVAPEEVLADGISATLHAGFYGKDPDTFPLEKHPKSAAYVDKAKNYFAGGFVGGTSKAFLEMCEGIRQTVNIDTENKMLALWHDESHLNRYLVDHPPAKILGPEFCCPDFFLDRLKPKIRLIQKAKRTVCLRCGGSVYQGGELCEYHSTHCYYPECTRVALRGGICGSHHGYVQLRTKGPDSHLKWCTWSVAERLEKIGMGEIIRDNN